MNAKPLIAGLLILLLCIWLIPGIQTATEEEPEPITVPQKTYTIELNTPITGIDIPDTLPEPPQTEPLPPQLEIPLSQELQQYTYKECGYDDELYMLVMAVMQAESGFNADSIGIDGRDHGLMQIRDCNLEHLEKQFGPLDLLNPYDNIKSGVYIVNNLMDKHEYKNLALMAYNCGETGARRLWKKGIYSTEYSRKVTEYYDCFVKGVSP